MSTHVARTLNDTKNGLLEADIVNRSLIVVKRRLHEPRQPKE